MEGMQQPAVLKAAALMGGQAALARALGVQPPTVNQWVSGKRPVPADKCPAIEELTANKVRRWELRPKDWHAIWTNLIDSPGAPRLKRAKATHG